MIPLYIRKIARRGLQNDVDHIPAGGSKPAVVTSSCKHLTSLKASLETIILHNMLEFWYPHVIDTKQGGYALNHDVRGDWKGKADKHLVAQTRTMWFFARLADSPYGKTEYLDAARHGYEFIRARMWDANFGGFYWSVSSSGQDIDKPDKHLYAQAFGLYALAEYGRASRDSKAIGLAQELFGLIESHAHDTRFGGYVESFQRDWSEMSTDQTGYLHQTPNVKLMNTHLHLLEAVTEYYRLTGDVLAKERVLELVLILSNTMVRKSYGACTDRYHQDWRAIEGDRRVSYGHDLENIWLLINACEAVGISSAPLIDVFTMLFNNSLKYGFDHRRGGFYESGLLGKRADKRQKTWWVQAEALLCALHMYNLTNDELYRSCFEKILNWIISYQIDWGRGEWHSRIDRGGRAYGDKAGTWKSPYHNGRAIIECLRLLACLGPAITGD